ncbi:MAG TPA: divergent polysaccharide deacetylase family protein [Thermodesulfobacteriota bacterium]
MGKRRKKGGRTWALVAAGFAAGVLLAVVLMSYMGLERKGPLSPAPKERVPQAAAPVEPPQAPPPAPSDDKPLFPSLPPPGKRIAPPKPRLAIVIDDMGQDMRKVRELISIGEPLTIAVMPNMRYSKEVSREASAKGLDVIMHMPMEPKDPDGHNPGDALLVAMTPAEIVAKMEEGLKTVPGAIGLNNHMGSKFTEDNDAMRTVLALMKKKEMLFLDSRTSSDTVGRKVARELRVKSAERNVFLDNTRDVRYIKGQLLEAARIAKKRGKAVAIGHPYPETIKALTEALPGLGGVEIVPISEIAE